MATGASVEITNLRIERQRVGGARWVLMTAQLVVCMDVLFDTVRGADVVCTDRDAAGTLSSFCSMFGLGGGVFSDEFDPIEIGDSW